MRGRLVSNNSHFYPISEKKWRLNKTCFMKPALILKSVFYIAYVVAFYLLLKKAEMFMKN